MDLGLTASFGSKPARDFGFVKTFAQATEQLGFTSLWAPEHVVFFPPESITSEYPYTEDGKMPWTGHDFGVYDPLFVIAIASSVTTRLRFGTSILILPQRPALLTAKEVMTLDHITQGRFELGVGSGWAAEEYAALGVPFGRRGKRFDEYIEAMRAAWTQDRAAYDGEFVSFENVVLLPKPVTPGGPPFLIGGDSKPAMRRAARLGDGWYGWWANYELEPHLAELRATLEAHGRGDDESFRLKLGLPYTGTPDDLHKKIDEARRLGVKELVLSLPIRSAAMEDDLKLWAGACGLV